MACKYTVRRKGAKKAPMHLWGEAGAKSHTTFKAAKRYARIAAEDVWSSKPVEVRQVCSTGTRLLFTCRRLRGGEGRVVCRTLRGAPTKRTRQSAGNKRTQALVRRIRAIDRNADLTTITHKESDLRAVLRYLKANP